MHIFRTFVFQGCILYILHNIWYFCPPPSFSKMIFLPPKYSKKLPFSPFCQLFPLIFTFLVYKSSYFFPNQPINHIFAPHRGRGGGKMNHIHPCCIFLKFLFKEYVKKKSHPPALLIFFCVCPALLWCLVYYSQLGPGGNFS